MFGPALQAPRAQRLKQLPLVFTHQTLMELFSGVYVVNMVAVSLSGSGWNVSN